MSRPLFCIAPLAICIATPSLGDDAAVRQAINGFYRVHQQSSQRGVPDAKERAKYAQYISPDLARLLTEADAAEARFAKPTKIHRHWSKAICSRPTSRVPQPSRSTHAPPPAIRSTAR